VGLNLTGKVALVTGAIARRLVDEGRRSPERPATGLTVTWRPWSKRSGVGYWATPLTC
jgi:hypothetical protein